MSGTRVMTTRPPLMAPSTSPSSKHGEDDGDADLLGWPFIRTAATTLVRAIIEPIDRSIPPEMTTIACPTAASASGRTEMRQALDARRRRSSAG